MRAAMNRAIKDGVNPKVGKPAEKLLDKVTHADAVKASVVLAPLRKWCISVLATDAIVHQLADGAAA